MPNVDRRTCYPQLRRRFSDDALDPWPGEWIHAVGEYTDKADESRKVAVCIGPEHGTVGRDLVKEAAKEAVKGVGYDLLVICGFAFDPSVDEETTRFGKLEVQMCRMNPDLSMGDELLKKTGAGNLFMIFGEPDVRVTSGVWLVARSGKLVGAYEWFEELPGFGGLAEINRLGGDDLPGLKRCQTRRNMV